MKKWLVILSITFGISFIISAVLAGQVYYKELNTYTDYDKQYLNNDALNKVYIESAIPIEIEPTEGDGYVEFSQTFIDLLGFAPEFELNLKTKGKDSYIELVQKKGMQLWLGIQDNTAVLTVYLPKKAYEALSIQDNKRYFSEYDNEYMLSLEDMDIDNLNIDINGADIRLKGNYKHVDIEMDRGSLEMNSNQPAELAVSGTVDVTLLGKYENISLVNSAYVNVDINAEQPTNLKINSNGSEIKLRGQYDKIMIDGYENTIDAKSESICKLSIGGESSKITANGAFKEINFNVPYSEVDLQTTAIPEYIKMLGEYSDTVSITLPSNIPGFQVKYETDKKYREEDDEGEQYYNATYLQEIKKAIYSDFNIVQNISSKGELTYTFGDGSIPITFNNPLGFGLKIIDGDYSSNQ